MRKKLVGLLALLSLAACEQAGDTYTTGRAQWDASSVAVQWVDAADVDAVCREVGGEQSARYGACAKVTPGHCMIYAPQPRGFNDRPGLALLGHEAWHCFGAAHRE